MFTCKAILPIIQKSFSFRFTQLFFYTDEILIYSPQPMTNKYTKFSNKIESEEICYFCLPSSFLSVTIPTEINNLYFLNRIIKD